jgi:hypothetical protein
MDTIMDVEVVEDEPSSPPPPMEVSLDSLGPAFAGPPSPPPSDNPGETFMVPQAGLFEADGNDVDFGQSDLGADDLGSQDLGGLDQGEALAVDGTEFADVDNLLDDLDDEE